MRVRTHSCWVLRLSLEVLGNRDFFQERELSSQTVEAWPKRDSVFCITLRKEIQFSKESGFYFILKGMGYNRIYSNDTLV